MPNTLSFETRFSGLSDLEKIGGILAEIGKRTVPTSGELKLLESVLKEDAKAGIALDATLKAIATSTASFTANTRAAVKEIAGHAAATDRAAQSEKRRGDEIQRLGRMQHLAQIEDEKRTIAINAQRIATEKAAVAEELRGRRQNIAGARGILNFVQAGMIPGGGAANQALSGSSILLTSGIGGLAGVAAGGTLALAALTAATIKLAASTAEAGRETLNMSERTGLTVREVGLFSGAAELAGVKSASLVTAMRTLSQGLSENSDEGLKAKRALAELGVAAVNSLGVVKPTAELYREIAVAFNGIQDPAERARLAIQLFGRGGLELLPLFRKNLEQLTDAVSKTGYAFTEEGAKKADEYAEALSRLDLTWQALKRSLGQTAIGVIDFAFGDSNLEKATKALSGQSVDQLKRLSSNYRDGTFEQEAIQNELARKLAADKQTELKRIFAGPSRPESPITSIKFRGQEINQTALAKRLEQGETSGIEGLQRRASEAKKALDAENVLAEGQKTRGALTQSEVEKVAALRVEYEKLEAQVKRAQAKPGHLNTEIEDLLEGLRSREGGPGSAVLERAAKFIRDKALTGRIASDIQLEASQAAIREQLSAGRAYQPFRLTLRDRNSVEKQSQFSTFGLSALSTISGIGNPEGLDEESSKDLTSGLHRASEIAKQNVNEKVGLSRKLLDDRLNVQRDSIIRQSSKAETLENLQLGGGSKGDGIERVYERRLQLAGELYSITIKRAHDELDATKRLELEDKARGELTKQRQDAELEREVRIAEVRKRQQEKFVSTAESGFRALIAGPGALGQFAKSQVLGTAETVVGNMARMAYPRIEGKTQLPGTGTVASPTLLGQLLSGSALGPQVTGKDSRKSVLEAELQLRDSNVELKASIDYLASALTGRAVPGSSATQAPPLEGIFTGKAASLAPLAAMIGNGGAGGFAGAIPSVIRDVANMSLTRSGGGGSAGSTVGLNFPFLSGSGASTQSLMGGDVAALAFPFAKAAKVPYGADPGSGEGGSTSPFAAFSKGGIRSNALDVLFQNKPDPGSGEGGSSAGQQVAAVAQLATAGYVAFRGISEMTKGGAKNVLGGLATTAGAIAPFTGPAAPFIEAGAMAVGLVAALLPDQRKVRQDQINSELQRNLYQAPVTQNRSQDIAGNFVDSDKYGRVRTSPFSAVPITTSPYTTKRNGVWYNIPGSTPSPFSTAGGAQIAPPPPMQVTVNMNSMDAKSGIDYFRNNPGVAHAAIHAGLTQATGPAQQAVRSVVGLL